MTHQLDHLVIAVRDLAQAMQDYQALGFTVVQGGRHASNATHNALVVLADGSYFELLAPTGEEAIAGFPDYRTVMGNLEGLIGYCLRSDNLQTDIPAMQGRGAAIGNAVLGGRVRPDGQELRWSAASLLDGSMMPFFIQEQTPREWRVPPPADPHPNGALATTEVHLLAYDLPQELKKLQALLGMMPITVKGGNSHEFDLEGFTLSIKAPSTPQERAFLGERPTLPYQLRIEGLTGPLDLALTHGVRFL